MQGRVFQMQGSIGMMAQGIQEGVSKNASGAGGPREGRDKGGEAEKTGMVQGGTETMSCLQG